MGEIVPFPGVELEQPQQCERPVRVPLFERPNFIKRGVWTVIGVFTLSAAGVSVAPHLRLEAAPVQSTPAGEGGCGFATVQPGDGEIMVLQHAEHSAGVHGPIANQGNAISQLRQLEGGQDLQPGERFIMSFDGTTVTNIQEVDNPNVNSCAGFLRYGAEPSSPAPPQPVAS